MIAEPRSWTLTRVCAAFALWALLVANWVWPVLRLSYQPLNHLVLAGALLLPALAVWKRPRTPRATSIGVLALGLPIAVLSTLLLTLPLVALAWTIVAGRDPSLERIRNEPAPVGGQVSVYRTNGGATAGQGIVVRHERALIPGVLLVVREVYGKYPADDARASWSGEALASFHGDAPVPLRRYVWF